MKSQVAAYAQGAISTEQHIESKRPQNHDL